jgi:hypothetical protein
MRRAVRRRESLQAWRDTTHHRYSFGAREISARRHSAMRTRFLAHAPRRCRRIVFTATAWRARRVQGRSVLRSAGQNSIDRPEAQNSLRLSRPDSGMARQTGQTPYWSPCSWWSCSLPVAHTAQPRVRPLAAQQARVLLAQRQQSVRCPVIAPDRCAGQPGTLHRSCRLRLRSYIGQHGFKLRNASAQRNAEVRVCGRVRGSSRRSSSAAGWGLVREESENRASCIVVRVLAAAWSAELDRARCVRLSCCE